MKKIDLAGIATGPKSTRSAHPVITVDAQMAQLLQQFCTINPQFKVLKSQTEALSAQLAPRIRSAYFARFLGITPDSSTMLVQVGDKMVKLICKSSYSTKLLDDAAVIAAIGEANSEKYFRQATVIKIDFEKMADAKQEEFATRVIAIAQELGVTDALSVKQCIQPRAGFHEARTSLLTVEQNIKLDAVLPITAFPQL